MTNICGLLLRVCLVLMSALQIGTALKCLNCDAIADPRLCRHITTCFKDEGWKTPCITEEWVFVGSGPKCGMETFISHDGNLQYKLGCVHENTCSVASTPVPTGSGLNLFYSCHDCCSDSDLCNIRGCNITGYPATRGPVCFNCEDYPVGYPCHVITVCEPHEVCFNEAILDFSSKMIYSTGCRSKHLSDREPYEYEFLMQNCADPHLDPVRILVGKRSTSICTDCCNGDLCNEDCEINVKCQDAPTCPLLMASYDICKTVSVAKEFCPKSCNMCPGAQMPGSNPTGVTVRPTSATPVPFVTQRTTPLVINTQATTTHNPVTSGATQPAMTTQPPAMTTRPPAMTTQPPAMTTRPPAMKTRPPAMTTQPPIITTQPPAMTTQPLAMTTQPLTMTTQQMKTTFSATATAFNSNATQTSSPIATSMVNQTLTNIQTSTKTTQQTVVMQSATVQQTTKTHPSTILPACNPSVTSFIKNGTAVIRGHDWKWGNQDGNGVGIVVDKGLTPGWVRVNWGNGFTNAYRNGAEGKCDLFPANYSVTSRPTTGVTTINVPTYGPALAQLLYVNARVMRGKDWKWDNQDSHGQGDIIAIPPTIPDGWVRVKWDNGTSNTYRMGADGAYDLMFVPGSYNPSSSAGK